MTQQGDLRYQLPTPQDSQLLADIGQAIAKRTQTDENPDRYSGGTYAQEDFDISGHVETANMDNAANDNQQQALTEAMTPLNILSQQLGIQESQSDLHNLRSMVPESLGQKTAEESNNNSTSNTAYVTLRDVERESGSRDFETSSPFEREAIQVVVDNVSLHANSTAELANNNHSTSDGNVINDGQQQELPELGGDEKTTESQISISKSLQMQGHYYQRMADAFANIEFVRLEPGSDDDKPVSARLRKRESYPQYREVLYSTRRHKGKRKKTGRSRSTSVASMDSRGESNISTNNPSQRSRSASVESTASREEPQISIPKRRPRRGRSTSALSRELIISSPRRRLRRSRSVNVVSRGSSTPKRRARRSRSVNVVSREVSTPKRRGRSVNVSREVSTPKSLKRRLPRNRSNSAASTSRIVKRPRGSTSIRGKRRARANKRSTELTSLEEQVEEGTASREDTIDEDSHDINDRSAPETIEEQSDGRNSLQEDDTDGESGSIELKSARSSRGRLRGARRGRGGRRSASTPRVARRSRTPATRGRRPRRANSNKLTSAEVQTEEEAVSKEDTVNEDSHDVNNKSASETMDEHSSFRDDDSDNENSSVELKSVRNPRGRVRGARRGRGSRRGASTSGVTRRSRTLSTRGKRALHANSNKLISAEEQTEEGTISKEDTVDEDSHDANNKSASETMEEQSDEHSSFQEDDSGSESSIELMSIRSPRGKGRRGRGSRGGRGRGSRKGGSPVGRSLSPSISPDVVELIVENPMNPIALDVESTSTVVRRSRTLVTTTSTRTLRANNKSKRQTALEEQAEEGAISKDDTVDEDSHDVNSKSASETIEERPDRQNRFQRDDSDSENSSIELKSIRSPRGRGRGGNRGRGNRNRGRGGRTGELHLKQSLSPSLPSDVVELIAENPTVLENAVKALASTNYDLLGSTTPIASPSTPSSDRARSPNRYRMTPRSPTPSFNYAFDRSASANSSPTPSVGRSSPTSSRTWTDIHWKQLKILYRETRIAYIRSGKEVIGNTEFYQAVANKFCELDSRNLLFLRDLKVRVKSIERAELSRNTERRDSMDSTISYNSVNLFNREYSNLREGSPAGTPKKRKLSEIDSTSETQNAEDEDQHKRKKVYETPTRLSSFISKWFGDRWTSPSGSQVHSPVIGEDENEVNTSELTQSPTPSKNPKD
ncbi:2450_t:CDS:2 [Paraglomus occultum]|uniref:2450_t:CDS:1 n=1 Tax=Paraglomus occultum TaxID=144539 RepID=A0A9N8ZNC4_9GLOM|nr:2450_t:CDS:2 [Paraglomus occultum]